MNGCRSDKAVFALSDLKESIEKGKFLNGSKVNIGTFALREYILADAGFNSSDYVVTPFTFHGIEYSLTEHQINYNRRISRCRVQVENGLGFLKNRFPILKKRNNYTP